jgi:hypothetical protein
VKDLLEALTIFMKYIPDDEYPTSCDHDVLYVLCHPNLVSPEDEARLRELSFVIDLDTGEGFLSFRFG